MLSCTRKFRFEAAHRLFGYDGLCRNIHGHSYIVEVTIRELGGSTDQVDNLGMLFDFGIIKKAIGGWIDDNWDHAMILNAEDPICQLYESSAIESRPCEDMKYFIMFGNPTAENMADLLLNKDFEEFGTAFTISKVTVWETENCCATKEL